MGNERIGENKEPHDDEYFQGEEIESRLHHNPRHQGDKSYSIHLGSNQNTRIEVPKAKKAVNPTNDKSQGDDDEDIPHHYTHSLPRFSTNLAIITTPTKPKRA